MLLITRPYDGIDWTGEAVDARWAALGAGFHPDVDSPAAPANAGVIAYQPMTRQQEADDAFIWRANGISVLSVYGRFYAGGSIQNDVDDMTAGLEFLAREPGVDTSRIGIFGGSWGGFEALYGAAGAPDAAVPVVGVALYPLSDFAAEYRFIVHEMPQRYTLPTSHDANTAFFAPYLRRVVATTGGTPDAGGDFSSFDVTGLATRLRTPFLLLHEDYDTLVGIDQSEALVAARPDLVDALYVRHVGPPQPTWDAVLTAHGPELGGFAGAGVTPFIVARLLKPLVSGTFYVPWSDELTTTLLWMRDRQRDGAPHPELAARLLELHDARVMMVHVNSGALSPGPDTVTTLVNQVWGTTYTPAQLPAALDGGLPP